MPTFGIMYARPTRFNDEGVAIDYEHSESQFETDFDRGFAWDVAVIAMRETRWEVTGMREVSPNPTAWLPRHLFVKREPVR